MKIITHPDKLKNKFLVLATVAFLITMQAVAFGKIFYDDMLMLEQSKKIRIQQVQDSRWEFIMSISKENLLRAEVVTKQIKKEIKKNIEESYANDIILKHDLYNPSFSSKLTKIFSESTEGIYLNRDNDNNDPFIIIYFGSDIDSRTGEIIQKGYVALDRSYNSAIRTGELKSLSDVIRLQANPKAAEECLEIILTNNTNTKQFFDRVWQHLDPGREELLISGASLESVKNKYDQYGLDALKTLEVLHSEYIEEKKGVFGKTDVNELGQRQETVKIIITQGFNPYEALTTHHQGKLESFEKEIINIEKELGVEMAKRQLVIILLVVLSLVVIVAVITIQNTLADLIEAEFNRG